MSLGRFGTEAGVEVEFRDEAFDSGASASTKEVIFRENLEFDFEGSVYHPKLMTFGGVLDLGLEQRRHDQRGAAETIEVNDENNRYDLQASFVKDHPYSARLFAQRTQERVRQTFFPTNEAVVTRNGAQLMAKEWVVPSQVEISSYEFDGRSGDQRHERRETLNATGSRNSDAFDVHYTMFTQEVDSDIAGGRYDDFQAMAGASWRFGPELANSISLDGQQREQTGDTQNENTTVGGHTRILLVDRLSNRSGLSFSRSKFNALSDSATDRTDAFTEFEHHLFDSLTSTVRADHLEQTIGTGDLTRSGGSGRLAYRKRVPFGQLRLDYRLGRSRQDDNGRFGANVTVNSEPHVVVFGSPVFLDNPNVDLANILVTDSSGTIVYTTPTDYLVDRIGISARLVFPAGSRILPGQTILVTYVFASSFDRTFDTDTQFAAVELMFGEGLSFETHWSELDQTLVSGVADATLDHATEVGVAVRAKYSDHNLSAEYLDRDSLLAPYSRATVSWYSWWMFNDQLGVGGNASAYESDFKDGLGRERGLSSALNLTWRPRERLSIEVRSELRRSALRTEDGWGLFVHGTMRYQFRKTSFDFTWMSSREEWDVSGDRDVVRALLTVSRRF